MKKTSLYLSPDENDALTRLAAATGRARAELVREAITEYARQHLDQRTFLSVGAGESDRPPGTSIADDEDEWMEGFGED